MAERGNFILIKVIDLCNYTYTVYLQITLWRIKKIILKFLIQFLSHLRSYINLRGPVHDNHQTHLSASPIFRMSTSMKTGNGTYFLYKFDFVKS